MFSWQFFVGALIAIIAYQSFTKWYKSFSGLFKPTKQPADPPFKEGPSPVGASFGCFFSFVRMAFVLLILAWFFWLLEGV